MNLSKLEYNPNHIFSGIIILLLVLVSSVGTPKVPSFLVSLFNNTVFKILYMTILLIVFKYKPMAAFVLALLFLLVLQTINNYHEYIETTTDKLNVHNLTKGLVNSASDAVSEVLSDTESIFTSVKSAVVNVAHHGDKSNSNKESFETETENVGSDSFEPNNEHFESSLSPMAYDNEKDYYNGPAFKYSIGLGLDNYESNFELTENAPLNQLSGVPVHHDPLLSNENTLKSLHGAVNSSPHLHPELQNKKNTKK